MINKQKTGVNEMKWKKYLIGDWKKTTLKKWGGGYTKIQENRGIFIIEQLTSMGGRNSQELHTVVLSRKDMKKINEFVNSKKLIS